MWLFFLLASWLMAGNGPTTPTTLIFSNAESGPWQRVSAHGQILGPVPDTPKERPAGCYGMGRLADRTLWVAVERFFYTERSGGMAEVETMAGQSARHLYRIRKGQKISRKPLHHSALLEELDPDTWAITRICRLPGNYRQFGKGHLTVNHAESIAYYTHEATSGIVRRHDLVRDVPLSDLVSRPVGSGGLLVLPNGSIIVGYTDGVQWISPDGSLRRVFEVGALGKGQGMLAHGPDDLSFWVQGFNDSATYSTLYEIGIDGTVRHEWNTPNNGVQWDAPFVDDQRWRY